MNQLARFLRCFLIATLALTLSASAQEKKAAKKGGGAKLPEGVQANKDLAYVPNGHERQKLDIFLPEKGEKLPLIVWIHGGGWRQGSKESNPALVFTQKGYAVASINYRLSQHAVWPAQIEDCKAAIRWLRANADKYRIDPDRIGVWGASAGGHLVAFLGTSADTKQFDKGENLKYSSSVQAVCDWFGPADFVKWMGSTSDTLTQLFGGPMTKEKATEASPVTYVSKKNVPFLIIHGDKDPLVPLNQSQGFEETLKKAGVEVKLVVLEGAAHGGPQFSTPEMLASIQSFFDGHLKAKK
jgi:acetyl esterase/lipase